MRPGPNYGQGELLDYEQKLLSALMKHGGDGVVTLDDLKNEFYTDLDDIQRKLYLEVTRRGWFSGRPDKVRTTWLVIGILATIVLGLVWLVAFAATTFGLALLPLPLAGLGLMIGSRWMPARTALGRRVYEDAMRYRKFLEVADADQLQYLESVNEFVDALPYAIVFGLTDKWAKLLASLAEAGVVTQPDWYVGPTYGNWLWYSHIGSGARDFNDRATSVVTSRPASTGGGSGFSGGSGGGFGGGGGGSW